MKVVLTLILSFLGAVQLYAQLESNNIYISPCDTLIESVEDGKTMLKPYLDYQNDDSTSISILGCSYSNDSALIILSKKWNDLEALNLRDDRMTFYFDDSTNLEVDEWLLSIDPEFISFWVSINTNREFLTKVKSTKIKKVVVTNAIDNSVTFVIRGNDYLDLLLHCALRNLK